MAAFERLRRSSRHSTCSTEEKPEMLICARSFCVGLLAAATAAALVGAPAMIHAGIAFNAID